ncbi:MAG: hypothetical protein M9894_02550 [Planctomycetes bacterium]|nr:hypothetical protein [Planctomycetota bacterium]
MSPEMVIALYRPHPGKERELDALVAQHVPALREAELITDRGVLRGRAKDGTVVEVFEWVSADAAERAHELPSVARVWEAMAQVADFVSLGDLPEAGQRFPHFAAPPR